MEGHPYEAPDRFFCPTPSTQIRVSQYVAEDGHIYLPYLAEWQYPRHNTAGLLQVMTTLFKDNCPVYSIPSGSSKPSTKTYGSQTANPKPVSYPMSSSYGVQPLNSSTSCRCSACMSSGDASGPSMFDSAGIDDLVASIAGSVARALTLGPADSDTDSDEEQVPYSTYRGAESFAFGSGMGDFSAQWLSTSSQSSQTTYSVGQASKLFGTSAASKPTRSQGAVKAVKQPASKAPAKVDCVKKVLPQYLEKPYRHNVYGLPTGASVVVYCDVPWPCASRKEFLTIELCADSDIAMQLLIKAQARVQLPTPVTVQCRQNGQWHHIQNYKLDLSGSRHKFMITVRKNYYQVNIAGKHVVNYGHMIAPSAISAIRIAGTVSDWAPKLEIYGLHRAQ
ncbi:UEV domain containing protein [Aphelenchoides avenae]|nr:UEV domain containing protein [Aphelenchus avenae]